MPPAPTPGDGGVFAFALDTAGQSEVQATCPLPAWDDDNFVAQQMLGKLASEIVRPADLPPTAIFGATVNVRQYVGRTSHLSLYTLVEDAHLPTALARLDATLAAVEAGELDPSRLALHKLHFARDYPTRWQSIEQMTTELSSNVLMLEADGRSWDWFDELGSSLAAVSVEDVAAALGDCREHLVVTVQGHADVVGPALDGSGKAWEWVDWQARRAELRARYGLD